jgi:plasmid stabilization system protein ParE
LRRFDRALRTNFGLLETFPDAFPSVDEYLGLTVRRVLLRGTFKALLYVVLEESLEVRVLSCYDTRSDHPNHRP